MVDYDKLLNDFRNYSIDPVTLPDLNLAVLKKLGYEGNDDPIGIANKQAFEGRKGSEKAIVLIAVTQDDAFKGIGVKELNDIKSKRSGKVTLFTNYGIMVSKSSLDSGYPDIKIKKIPSAMNESEKYKDSWFSNKGAKANAENGGLVSVENEDLTPQGLIAKMKEWDEMEHGVPEVIYDETEKTLTKSGIAMPKDIRRLMIWGRKIKESDNSQDFPHIMKFDSFVSVNEAYYAFKEPHGEIRFETPSQAALYTVELTGQLSDGAWENSGPYDHWEFWADLVPKVGTPGITMYEGFYDRPIKRSYRFVRELDVVFGRMIMIGRMARALDKTGDAAFKMCDTISDLWSDGIMTDDQIREKIEKSKDGKDEYWRKLVRPLTDEIMEKFFATEYSEKDMKNDLNMIGKVMRESDIKVNESLVVEGWMSEIDAIAQQAPNREEFKKELKKLFKGHKKEKEITSAESLESMAKDYFDYERSKENIV